MNLPTPFYNVQHAPLGAFASFTCGCKGARGGLGLELGGPADESLYIGVETRAGGRFEALPFYDAQADDRRRFEVGDGDAAVPASPATIIPFADGRIRRKLEPHRDCWRAGDLTFTIFSPCFPVPDPASAREAELRDALLPAVLAELTVDNRAGRRPRLAFVGYAGRDPHSKMRRLDDGVGGRFCGVGIGRRTAICCRDAGAVSGLGFTIDAILHPAHADDLTFALGDVGALRLTVPAGVRRTFRLAICFHRDGIVTAGRDARYAYTRFFRSIEEVADHALKRFDGLCARSEATVASWPLQRLSAPRRWQLAQAIHSYYGSTQLLQTATGPLWVVNEGEYRMMNTFDLTVDQLFFELRLNPWTVRNVLDAYRRRHSYRDRVRFPGAADSHPGGLSFTHDMGVANSFAAAGHSAYERGGTAACFAHMTHEQLVNWVCCATLYIVRTGDTAWFRRQAATLRACFASLCRRDHPDPAQRDGVMSLDSARCRDGAEITTYDSLDASLGQARGNLYLAVKSWAAYRCLAWLFEHHARQPRLAARMAEQARRGAATIMARAAPDGTLPALLDGRVASRILPAIEGLIFVQHLSDGGLLAAADDAGELARALRRHVRAVLKPGLCLFDDGGWKLSSTSDNSWLSKIYLCQFIAEHILGVAPGAAGRRADAAHQAWLLRPENAYYAWSDQMVAGTARGSKYYPRGVTAILWLEPLRR